MLLLLLILPLIGGVLAWIGERHHPQAPRWIALAALTLDLLVLWSIGAAQPEGTLARAGVETWISQLQWHWIARFGIGFHLALDGLSLVLVALTLVLGIISVLASWTEIKERVGFFHFHLLWALAGALGVFLAFDLFLFFFLWELMLVPMYFVIALWGHENRRSAAIKFFIFTQASGLLMLIAILALVFIHYQATGSYSFDYFDLLDTPMSRAAAFWIMLGFFIAFAVKLPVVPVHTWLPDAHTEAPTGGSIILAGVLLKTGAYGLLRFAVPLFPQAAAEFAPVAMALGVVGILYGALLAFAQDDFKRLIAYTSISHLGFVLLGTFAWNSLALRGVVVQMVAHGLTTGALFFLAGALQERLGTRDMRRMGGLWQNMPRLAGFGLFFAVAALGLPGLANFVGEFLILLGTYQVSIAATAWATLGLVGAVVYALMLVQKTFYGESRHSDPLPDLDRVEWRTLFAMAVLMLWLGVHPQPVLDAADQAVASLQHIAAQGLQVANK